MKKFTMIKRISTLVLAVCLLLAVTMQVSAATTNLLKDGEFQTGGFINAGEAVDGVVQGPGNWTQLNMADAAVDAPYLHVIMKATGDTAKAQIAVSDTYTFNISDLGVTLTEEFQDVVLPVQENGLTMISWMNFMGLDGGSSVYSIKDVFLSDDANSSLATETAAVAESTTDTTVEETTDATVTTETTEVPKTGSSNVGAVIAFITLTGSAFVYVGLKKCK
jgi:hypothetical protein